MSFHLEKTPWLPPAPGDFTARCKALAEAENCGALAASLASFALTPNQCASFARALSKPRRKRRFFSTIRRARIFLSIPMCC